MSVFAYTKHFSETEKWGNPAAMNGSLILLLDALREAMGRSFIIHCGWEANGHAENSQHYLGNAVDFHVKNMAFRVAARKLLALLEDMSVASRVGFGVYPHWNFPGFHLDVRGYKSRWGRVVDSYVPMSKALEHSIT